MIETKLKAGLWSKLSETLCVAILNINDLPGREWKFCCENFPTFTSSRQQLEMTHMTQAVAVPLVSRGGHWTTWVPRDTYQPCETCYVQWVTQTNNAATTVLLMHLTLFILLLLQLAVKIKALSLQKMILGQKNGDFLSKF